MEKQFKVGDKVMVIGSGINCKNKVGDKGVITEDDSPFYRVTVKGNEDFANWHSSGELELIERKDNKALKLLKTYIKLLLFRYYINDQYGKPEKQTWYSIYSWAIMLMVIILAAFVANNIKVL